MAVIPSIITADEVNCLIYSYLSDSGFTHSAFTVKTEAQLHRSPNFGKHIRRGELVELLSKALLYLEVESHWNGSALALNCRSPFSLLEPHICSLDPNVKAPVLKIPVERPNEPRASSSKTTLAASPKRKAAAPPDDTSSKEKRTKVSDDRMDVDSNSTQPNSDQDEDRAAAIRPPATSISHSLQFGKQKRAMGPADSTTDPKAIRLLKGHESEVFVCGWNPMHTNLLASGSKDAIVHIWDLPASNLAEPGTPLTVAYMPKKDQGDLTSLDWNADGTLLAIGSYDAILRVCTLKGDLYMSSPLHSGPIFATRFSPSGRWLLTASLDGTAIVWDVSGKKMYKQFAPHNDKCCLDIDWLDDNTFASCGADRLIHILRLENANPIRTLRGHTDEINQIRFNKSSTRLASGSDDKTARIWNVDRAGGNVVTLSGHQNSVSTIGWCPYTAPGSNELLATSGFDGTARLWDSVTGACLKVFDDHARAVFALSFCPDGQWIATGGGDGWVHVYDLKVTKNKTWSWYAGKDSTGVFEVDWQRSGGADRIAFALESRQVGVVYVDKVNALQRH